MSELIETQINNSLTILDEKEASLIELKNKYTGLTISGLDDKQGYLSVREGRMALKKERVKVENDAFALRENANKFRNAVIKREKELIAIIEPLEQQLKKQEDEFNALREKQREEDERKERARIQARIDALAKYNHAHDLYELTIMEEENFQALLGEAQAAFEREQERISAEKAEAERQRIAEQDRINAERAELDRQRAEFKKREEALFMQRERELEEQRVKEIKLKQEHEAKEAALRAEREKLEAEKRAIAESKAKAEAEERARIEESERQKREILEKEQARIHEELERERQEALKPDKEKILNFLDGLISGKTLILETSEGVALMNAFSDQLRSLIADFKDNLNQL
jgi:colicin import membrane protein